MDPRPLCPFARRAIVLALLGLAARGGYAHDMWVVPPEAAGAVAAGELVEVRMRVGHREGHEPVRRADQRLLRFAAVPLTEVPLTEVPGTGVPAAAEQPVAGLDGTDPAGFFRPLQAGLWAIVYESRAEYSELGAERFRGYLEEEGLDAVVELRRQRGQDGEPGRELYSRSLKSLVRVAGAEGADRALGLPLELVAETPSERWGRKPMALRLLWHGQPLRGALVDVRRLDGPGVVFAARTDRRGRVRFELGPGVWMAAAVHMVPEGESPRADWRSVFATLTWRVPADGASAP